MAFNLFHTKQSAPQTAPISFPKIDITGIGLSCVAGDQPFALLGMVGAHISGTSVCKEVAIPAPDGSGDSFALINGLPELAELTNTNERIQFHAAKALAQVISQVSPDTDWKKLAVVTMLPDTTTSRGKNIKHDHLWELFLEIQPQLSHSTCEFVPDTKGTTSVLDKYCRKLASGELQTVLFGGIDSQVDAQTCTEIAMTGQLMAEGCAEGIIPGEGAAWLMLQPDNAPKKIATITGASLAHEPYHGASATKPMTGLLSAMTNALHQAGLEGHELQAVVLPFSGTRITEMEWYQVTQQLCPNNKEVKAAGKSPTEQEPLEEWRPHPAIGHTGAAIIPIHLALACGRLEFNFPKVNEVMVCEAGTTPFRGAIIIHS